VLYLFIFTIVSLVFAFFFFEPVSPAAEKPHAMKPMGLKWGGKQHSASPKATYLQS
jgi:hypothetical protein